MITSPPLTTKEEGGTPKVMKIVKLFVVFNLILSISLINSVAAISVSDGSAFVTKAEFAADLNNLSNRMSTLENSLDAKIDSLVSSYLSRNGIWNGEKQTNIVKEISLGTGISFSTNYNNKYYSLKINQHLTTLSKSGLVRLRLASEKRVFATNVILSSEITGSSFSLGSLSISLFFNKEALSSTTFRENSWFSVNNKNISSLFESNLTSWKFMDLDEKRHNSSNIVALLSRAAFQEYIYFFAQKNDNIYANVIAIGSVYGQQISNKTMDWENDVTTIEYEMNVY